MSGKKVFKVFISSTYLDNEERRKLVADAVNYVYGDGDENMRFQVNPGMVNHLDATKSTNRRARSVAPCNHPGNRAEENISIRF